MKGYKAFNEDLTCINFQYEIGKEYELEGELKIGAQGFHFCKTIADCYNFYYMNEYTRICEIEALGEIISDKDEIKFCTNKIKIIAEITGEERKGNTSLSSTGYVNTGDWNTGNRNTGNRNTGDCNTGDWNTGNCNTGDWNTGNCNTGNRNTGNRNTGDWNTGNCNTGDCNTGNRNTGYYNIGNRNTGNCNIGNRNTGDWNTGNCNTGNRNTGDWNTGNCNTGDWNTGNCSSGLFNTERYPKIKIFDKESDWTMKDWIHSKARFILSKIPMNRIDYHYYRDMTEEEKEQHPEAKTCTYYTELVEISNDDKQKWWEELSEEDKQEVLSIPNFDTEKFFKCTGIRV